MDYSVFHRYNTLARDGKAKTLICKYCQDPLVLSIGDDDEPVLKCFSCNITTVPGLVFYENIKSQVEEWNV